MDDVATVVALDIVDVAENKLAELAVVAVEAELADSMALATSCPATTLIGSGRFGLEYV